MRVLFLRPEGAEVPSSWRGMEIVKISIFKPKCLDYELPKNEYSAIAFTSVNGVRCAKKLPKFYRVYAVGPATAAEVVKLLGVNPLVPRNYEVSELVKEISGEDSVLMFRSQLADVNDVRMVADKVDVVRNYTLELNGDAVNAVRRILEDCEVDVVAVTSPSIARVVAGFLKPCVLVASIGPTTSKVLSEAGVKFIEAEDHTIEGVLKKIEEVVRA
jgi:uroporphyrinogen-III synthase